MNKLLNFLLTIVIGLSWAANGSAMNKTASSTSHGSDGQAVYWYERGVKKHAWMALDEIAVFSGKGQTNPESRQILSRNLHPQALITEETDAVTILKSPEPITPNRILQKFRSIRSIRGVHQVSPVFYSDSNRHRQSRQALTGEIIVQFPQELSSDNITALEKQYGLIPVEQLMFAENTFLYRTSDALNSLKLSNSLVEAGYVTYAYPNWARSRSKRSTPDDPLFANQWHLANTGQSFGTTGEDVNITSVWDKYIGSSNEIIAIVDDGLDINHEDLKDNVIPNLSWDYVSNDADPSHGGFWDGHGTNVAGVAAGRGFNGVGIAGAAPFAGLVGHRLLGGIFMLDANEADALTRNSNIVDIYSNSWGPADWSPYGQAACLEGPGPPITTTDSDDPSGYTNWFNGTSAATPLVSGVIALMLQANPDLTWRDVQHILIETAEQNDSADSDWTFNGAGYAVNHKYGFGRIDALSAVNAAKNWTPVGPETSVQETSFPYISVPDNGAHGVSDTMSIAEDIFVEFVEIYFTAADHPCWGDLEIILTSPSGTQSILSEVHNVSANGTTYNNWRFGSVRHYGESSQGNWTLQVKDLQPGDSGTLQSWILKIYGNKGILEPDIPTVTTAVVDSVTVNSAFLKGGLSPNGAATSYYFEYGTTDGYGKTTQV